MNDAFPGIFEQLKAILVSHSEGLTVVTDKPDSYYLDTTHIMKNKKPLFFGAVRIAKSYVSFHLMPVYAEPGLLEGISPALKKKMQGKSCFNFKKPEAELFAELGELTGKGRQYYCDEGFV